MKKKNLLIAWAGMFAASALLVFLPEPDGRVLRQLVQEPVHHVQCRIIAAQFRRQEPELKKRNMPKVCC